MAQKEPRLLRFQRPIEGDSAPPPKTVTTSRFARPGSTTTVRPNQAEDPRGFLTALLPVYSQLSPHPSYRSFSAGGVGRAASPASAARGRLPASPGRRWETTACGGRGGARDWSASPLTPLFVARDAVSVPVLPPRDWSVPLLTPQPRLRSLTPTLVGPPTPTHGTRSARRRISRGRSPHLTPRWSAFADGMGVGSSIALDRGSMLSGSWREGVERGEKLMVHTPVRRISAGSAVGRGVSGGSAAGREELGAGKELLDIPASASTPKPQQSCPPKPGTGPSKTSPPPQAQPEPEQQHFAQYLVRQQDQMATNIKQIAPKIKLLQQRFLQQRRRLGTLEEASDDRFEDQAATLKQLREKISFLKTRATALSASHTKQAVLLDIEKDLGAGGPLLRALRGRPSSRGAGTSGWKSGDPSSARLVSRGTSPIPSPLYFAGDGGPDESVEKRRRSPSPNLSLKRWAAEAVRETAMSPVSDLSSKETVDNRDLLEGWRGGASPGVAEDPRPEDQRGPKIFDGGQRVQDDDDELAVFEKRQKEERDFLCGVLGTASGAGKGASSMGGAGAAPGTRGGGAAAGAGPVVGPRATPTESMLQQVGERSSSPQKISPKNSRLATPTLSQRLATNPQTGVVFSLPQSRFPSHDHVALSLPQSPSLLRAKASLSRPIPPHNSISVRPPGVLAGHHSPGGSSLLMSGVQLFSPSAARSSSGSPSTRIGYASVPFSPDRRDPAKKTMLFYGGESPSSRGTSSPGFAPVQPSRFGPASSSPGFAPLSPGFAVSFGPGLPQYRTGGAPASAPGTFAGARAQLRPMGLPVGFGDRGGSPEQEPAKISPRSDEKPTDYPALTIML